MIISKKTTAVIFLLSEVKRESNEYFTEHPLQIKKTNHASETYITYISMFVPDMHSVYNFLQFFMCRYLPSTYYCILVSIVELLKQ